MRMSLERIGMEQKHSKVEFELGYTGVFKA